jgi:hypothetical protein
MMKTLVLVFAMTGCRSTEIDPKDVGTTQQDEDGCGAGLYLGTTALFCDYGGYVANPPTTFSGSCNGDGQVVCTFSNPNGICGYRLNDSSSGTADKCYDASVRDYCAAFGGTGTSITDPSSYTITLTTGDTTCDPPGSADQLSTFCSNAYAKGYPQGYGSFNGAVERACGRVATAALVEIDCCMAKPTDAGTGGTGYGGGTYGRP